MPELPDIVVYAERIRALAGSQPLESLRVQSPFLLRTYDPMPDAFAGRLLTGVERIGKRIVMCFDERNAGQVCHAGRCASGFSGLQGVGNRSGAQGDDSGAGIGRTNDCRRNGADRSRLGDSQAEDNPASNRRDNTQTYERANDIKADDRPGDSQADDNPASNRRDNTQTYERANDIKADDRPGDSQSHSLFAVIHLMIAGRLRWTAKTPGAAAPSNKAAVALFDFPEGSIVMTEAGTKRRASLHLVRGRPSLTAFDRGGINVFDDSPRGVDAFAAALRRENRTVKRALTDPSIVDGIGNAYSDEILHRARLSPYALTRSLDDAAMAGLRKAAADVLDEWIARLRDEAGPTLPDKVTAFHPEMAVHGKYGKPCPVCGTPVQRLVYAENEANYCPTCQTGGKLLADRALSRLLKNDWPRTLEELENLTRR